MHPFVRMHAYAFNGIAKLTFVAHAPDAVQPAIVARDGAIGIEISDKGIGLIIFIRQGVLCVQPIVILTLKIGII